MTEENQIILYTGPDGDIRVEVLFRDESLWLTQKRMAELFGVDIRTISEHLKTIFKSGELVEESVIRNFRITAADGKEYPTNLYHLDAIIAIGYRVNSRQATRFRVWATAVLRDFITKGFVLDDQRLKQGVNWSKDYFDELLERIREIRASERRFYQKITDIYAQCSADYDPKSSLTLDFYAAVQNKLHWAITHQTAAELVASRADASTPHMGLTSWKKAPRGKVLKSDVSVAKNYLNAKEIRELNRIVTMYLDYAERQAERQIPMTMKEWAEKLDAFLQFNDYHSLKNAGKISAEVAKKLAEEQYNKFRVTQDLEFESDFDREIKRVLGEKKDKHP